MYFKCIQYLITNWLTIRNKLLCKLYSLCYNTIYPQLLRRPMNLLCNYNGSRLTQSFQTFVLTYCLEKDIILLGQFCYKLYPCCRFSPHEITLHT